jgi:hypothetical protein
MVFLIKSWDTERVILKIDGIDYFVPSKNHGSATSNRCGGSWNDPELSLVSFDLIPHTFSTVNIVVST